ncbi:hypothetical protein CHUAL_001907 [Chamberlinius hualienensis]
MITRTILCASVLVLVLALWSYKADIDWHGVFNHIKSIPVVGPFIIDVAAAIFHPGTTSTAATSAQSSVTTSPQSETSANTERLFTSEEFKAYSGEKGLYLCILGLVYDVSKGERFYAKGKTYHGFTGRDASRSFITGDFTEEGLRDDVMDLKSQDILQLEQWLDTYKKDYIYKGKLIGRYFDENGKPTEDNLKFQKLLEHARAEARHAEDRRKTYPPCDSKYVKGEGGKVYCTKTSGGISRDWVGFPRRLFTPETGNVRCACIQESRLKEGNLSEFPGCSPTAYECVTSTN